MYEEKKKRYADEISSYYGWFWGDSSFLGLIKIIVCFEFLVEKNVESATALLAQSSNFF